MYQLLDQLQIKLLFFSQVWDFEIGDCDQARGSSDWETEQRSHSGEFSATACQLKIHNYFIVLV